MRTSIIIEPELKAAIKTIAENTEPAQGWQTTLKRLVWREIKRQRINNPELGQLIKTAIDEA